MAYSVVVQKEAVKSMAAISRGTDCRPRNWPARNCIIQITQYRNYCTCNIYYPNTTTNYVNVYLHHFLWLWVGDIYETCVI